MLPVVGPSTVAAGGAQRHEGSPEPWLRATPEARSTEQCDDRCMTDRPSWVPPLAWGLGGASVLGAAAGVWLEMQASSVALPAGVEPGGSWAFGVAVLAVTAAGSVVAAAHPRNPVGWLFLAQGLGWQVAEVLLPHYRVLALDGSGGGATWTSVVYEVAWIVPVATVPMVLLLFPDGRLPSPRWRPVPTALLVGVSAIIVGVGATPGPLASTPPITNPLGHLGAAAVLSVVATIGGVLFLAGSIGGIASVLFRYRRADSIERLQLRWLAYAAGLVLVAWVVASVGEASGWSVDLGNLRVAPLLGLPVAVAVAIRQHRLYDIDTVIDRTLVYLGMTAFVTGLYVVVVVTLGSLLGSQVEGNLALSLVATSVVATLFAPVRHRLQRFIDRLVFGARATPYEVLSAFTRRVADALPVDEALEHMARVVAEGTAADVAEVWVRREDHLHLAARWPPDGAGDEGPEGRAIVGDVMPPLPGLDLVLPVRAAAHIHGAIGVRTSVPIRPAVRRLLADLADAASYVLENAHLLSRLQASRRRLVMAQAAERRRIERDLHDGAQQRLLEVVLQLGIVRRALEVDGGEDALAHLDLASERTTIALAELRELVHGIHPAILAQYGLAAAVGSLAERAGVPVVLDVHVPGRLPDAIEATAYFVVAEALTNVVKHANASRATVSVKLVDDRLVVAVQDDGGGCPDPAGFGLQGLADRVTACDGVLRITGGHGTLVSAELPCA